VAIISDGTTIADAGAFSASLGSMILIKTITLSSAAGTIDFLNGASDVVFDGTYPSYKFVFNNIHPASESYFTFQVDVGTATSYAQTITSSVFKGEHAESGATGMSYRTTDDQAQGTAFQRLGSPCGDDADESFCGELQIFAPSSGTFVKHFIGKTNTVRAEIQNYYVAGHVNTTTALTRIRFKFSSGNIDSGTIKMYGIKDS